MKTKPFLIMSFLVLFALTTVVGSLIDTKTASAALKTGAALANQAYAECKSAMQEDIPQNSDPAKACIASYSSTYSDPSRENLDKFLGIQGVQGSCNRGNWPGWCLKGVELGPKARVKDNGQGGSGGGGLSDQQIKAIGENDSACNVGAPEFESACLSGFVAGYKASQSEKDACKQKDTQEQNWCKKGYSAGQDSKKAGVTVPKTVTEEEKKTIQEAKTECEKAKQKGSYLDTCQAAYLAAVAGKKKSEVCGDDKFVKNSDSQKACEKGFALGASSVKPKEQVDCDAKLSSILSWIACPIIDMGVAFTDYVFEGFVQPMLETVPVSTDPSDGSYKAWKQFRILANVLLVGSLLAIVFSQARGGGR